LVDIIKTGSTPLTIGVFGTWGSGKTSLMRMVKKRLVLPSLSEHAISWTLISSRRPSSASPRTAER